MCPRDDARNAGLGEERRYHDEDGDRDGLEPRRALDLRDVVLEEADAARQAVEITGDERKAGARRNLEIIGH